MDSYGCIGSGSSTQYTAVKMSMENIERSLKSTPSATSTLSTKFKQEGWIDTTEDCTEAQLVQCALEKIRQDSDKFPTFVSMLNGTAGMSDIAVELERLCT